MEICSNRGYNTQDGVSGAVRSIGCNTLLSDSKSRCHFPTWRIRDLGVVQCSVFLLDLKFNIDVPYFHFVVMQWSRWLLEIRNRHL